MTGFDCNDIQSFVVSVETPWIKLYVPTDQFERVDRGPSSSSNAPGVATTWPNGNFCIRHSFESVEHRLV